VTESSAAPEQRSTPDPADGRRPTSAGRQAHGGPGATRASQKRGRYFTLQQAAEQYPAFTTRLLRRLVQERRIAFSRVGRNIVFAEADIEAYVEANRVEPPGRSPQWDLAS
jgi:excisionase family DNA binding protein